MITKKITPLAIGGKILVTISGVCPCLQAPFRKKTTSSQDTVVPDLFSVPANIKELPPPLCIGHSIVEVQ